MHITNSFRALAWAFVAGATLTTSSCGSKSSDPQAQAATATLSGEVAPAGSVTTVTATNASGATVTATPNATTGAYSFPNLAPGAYTLTFAPTVGYNPLAPVAVALATGGTTAPAATATLASPSASYTVNGAVVTATAFYSQPLNNLLVATFTTNSPGTASHRVELFFLGVEPRVGARSLANNDNAAYYTGPNGILYCTNCGGGSDVSGTVNVTAVGTNPRRFSGTFTFVATAFNSSGSAPYTMAVTNGSFANIPY